MLSYEEFKSMMEYNGDFLTVGLDCKGAKHNFLDTRTNIARWQYLAMEYDLEKEQWWPCREWNKLTTFLEENRQNIFYLIVFFTINVWLFAERFIRK